MKRTFVSALMLMVSFLAITAFSTSKATAQCPTDILTGCVGACGTPYDAAYTVTAADGNTLCFSVTGSSLCPSNTARFTVKVGNKTVFNGVGNPGDSRRFRVRAGDVVTIHAELGAGDPNIQCIWLGETYFGLGH